VALKPKNDVSRLVVQVSMSHVHTRGRFLAEIANYTTRNKYKSRILMPSAGFKLAILATERPKTHALDHTATGIA